MNIQYSKKSWFNNIQVANVQSYIARRCFIKFNLNPTLIMSWMCRKNDETISIKTIC